MSKARIKLAGQDPRELDAVCTQIREIASRTGVAVKGPIPLPTKHLRITTRKTPAADGSHTFEKWNMRIHKRVIDIEADARALRQIMRVQVPDTVHIEINIE